MLRPATARSLIRCFHTSSALQAAKAAGPKASAQGFKKAGAGGSNKPSKKGTGSSKMFQDHVHKAQYSKKATFQPDLTHFQAKLQEGQLAQFSQAQQGQLHHCGAFKKDQFLEIFSSPVTLVRDETKQLEDIIARSTESPSSKNRVCILGERGIGKSTLLTQATALALQNENAVVIPISYALRLIDGSTDYWFDPKLGKYTQPMITKRLLDKIRHVNKDSLAQIPLTKEYHLESAAKGHAAIKFNTTHTLASLFDSKMIVSGRQRGQLLEILLTELANQSKCPVYFTVDNFSALTASPATQYRNTENKPLYLEDFQISNWILQLTSGEKEFKKGAVLLATSGDDRETLTLSAGLGLAQVEPYTPVYQYNKRIAEKLKGVQALEVKKLPKDQVRELVKLLKDADAFRADELEQKSLEQIVSQKYVLSGNGNPLELFRSVVMYL